MHFYQTPLALGVLAAFATTSAIASAQCPAADAFEPNDSCATATAITSGLYSNLSLDGLLAAGGSNDDFYVVNVPNGELLTVTCLHTAAAGNIDVALYDATWATCGDLFTTLATHFVVLDDEEVSWLNSTGVAVDVVIQATYSQIDALFACNDYALDIAIVPDPCVAAIDDAFEPNDDCASSVTLATGTYNDLYVTTTDEDFFKVTVNPTDQVVITTTYPSVIAELSIELYDDAACTSLVKSESWGGGYIQVEYGNATGAAKDYYIRVNPIITDTATCNLYDLDIATQPDPCLTATDDSFEPNDDCVSTVTLPTGLSAGLFISSVNEDFYKVTIPNTEQIVIDQTWSNNFNTLAMDLYSDATCSVLVATAGWGSGSNQLIYGNGTGASADYYLRVYMQGGECGDYDLNVLTQPDPCILTPDDSLEPNDDCASKVPLSMGLHTGLFMRTGDEDYYSVTVPAGHFLTIDQTYAFGNEMGIDLYTDPLCTAITQQAGWGGGLNTQVYANTLGAPVTIYYHCYMINGDCSSYDLNVSSVPDPCQLAADDSFEPNDFCGTGPVLPLGASTGLFVAQHDHDYYQIDVPAAQVLTIDQTYVGGSTELGMILWDDPSCSIWLYGSSWGGGFNSVSWANTTGATHTVYLSCDTQIGTGFCLNYDLNVSLAPDPCQQPGSDDLLEDNDDCASATPVSVSGASWTDLFGSKTDPDFFTFTLPDGASMQIDATFLNIECDFDMYLYDEASIMVLGCGDSSSYLIAANNIGDNESLSWSNTTGSTVTYYLKVEAWGDASNAGCGLYDLDISFGGSAFAEPFCFGDGVSAGACPCANESTIGANEGCVSSIGVGAKLSVSGSNSIAADDLTFTVTQARPHQTSLLLQGTAEITLPFKDGILCMGNPTERIEVVTTDVNGSGTTTESVVTNGHVTVPGTTRYYQQWFRDPGGVSPCGNGSNFSHGLRVLWGI